MRQKKDYEYTIEELVEIAKSDSEFSSPSFQLYVNDVLGSKTFMTMDATARGGYLSLLFWEWNDRECGLDCDENELMNLAKLSVEQWNKYKKTILKNFQKVGEKLYNRRLLIERKKQVLLRLRNIRGGINSAKAKKIKRLEKLTTLKNRLGFGKDLASTKDNDNDKEKNKDINNKSSIEGGLGGGSGGNRFIRDYAGIFEEEWQEFKKACPPNGSALNPMVEVLFKQLCGDENVDTDILIQRMAEFCEYWQFKEPNTYPHCQHMKQCLNWLTEHQWEIDWKARKQALMVERSGKTPAQIEKEREDQLRHKRLSDSFKEQEKINQQKRDRELEKFKKEKGKQNFTVTDIIDMIAEKKDVSGVLDDKKQV